MLSCALLDKTDNSIHESPTEAALLGLHFSTFTGAIVIIWCNFALIDKCLTSVDSC